MEVLIQLIVEMSRKVQSENPLKLSGAGKRFIQNSIFHRPLHCYTLRRRILMTVFIFLNQVIKNGAAALRITDLRQLLFLVIR